MILFEKIFPEGRFTCSSQHPDEESYKLLQVHGNKVVQVDELSLSKCILTEADGMTTKEAPFKTMAIKTADCLPILVIGKNGLAMLHAGWRGVHTQIMIQKEIQDLDPYYFFIGPHIQRSSFEVTSDFKKNFPLSPHFYEQNGSLFFDLASQTRDIILDRFPNSQIENCNICTYENEDYHSFRRNQTPLRNWSLFYPESS